jgi:hypothetical protein
MPDGEMGTRFGLGLDLALLIVPTTPFDYRCISRTLKNLFGRVSSRTQTEIKRNFEEINVIFTERSAYYTHDPRRKYQRCHKEKSALTRHATMVQYKHVQDSRSREDSRRGSLRITPLAIDESHAPAQEPAPPLVHLTLYARLECLS